MLGKSAEGRTEMTESKEKWGGRNPQDASPGVLPNTVRKEQSDHSEYPIMRAVLEYTNISEALKRVVGNKGAPGVDKMTVAELDPYLKDHWSRIEQELLEGRYKPAPVRGVEIPKNGGGMRKLGIPTVLDRLIQQALHQVLSPIFEEDFSEHSFGFRPGRSTHQAILQAQRYVTEGKEWVVDIDLEKFFDRVNHDILMSRIARKIKDKRVLLVIRRFLQAGLMEGGLTSARVEGTPQGGPLSPLLSNIMLHELDQELKERGHAFCRYADDCNIYVQTERSGQRVMKSIREFLERRLKLKVNEKKSAVARSGDRKFLAYSIINYKGNPKLAVAMESIKKMKEKIKERTRKGRGKSIKETVKALTPLLRGWVNYFKLIEELEILKKLDRWVRRKLRCIIWRQLKKPRTREKTMIKQGANPERAKAIAWAGKGPWYSSCTQGMHQAYTNKYFDKLGLCEMLREKLRMRPL